jgi:hypothetical protein
MGKPRQSRISANIFLACSLLITQQLSMGRERIADPPPKGIYGCAFKPGFLRLSTGSQEHLWQAKVFVFWGF